MDFIDVKPEYISTLLDYCIHLANLKDGFANVKATESLKNMFVQNAANNNLRLIKRGQSVESMLKKTKREEEDQNRIIEKVA